MKITAIITGAVVIVVLLAAGCEGGKPPSSNPQVAEKEPVEVNSVTLKPEMTERVKIGHPELIDISDKLQVPSQIGVNEHGLLLHVSTYVTGRIIEIHAMLGDRVEAGAALARITSPELTQAQLVYLSASSQTRLAEKSVDRARHLVAADVIAVAEMERRESQLQIVRAELESARDHLHLLGVNNQALKEIAKHGHILPAVAITASAGGIVIERNIVVGQVVEPADQLFKVADLSSVWAVGAVPEQVARNVQVGQHVEIHVPALGDASFDGLIVFVADLVNPLTRTVEVKTEVDNPQRKLKPSMLATMHINDNLHKSLVVPAGAVVREDNRDYVFIAQGNNRFLRIPVELGPEIDTMRPVLKGLTIEQSIVIEGAFDLNNERKLAELH
ncbi:efflux RND transporter periplasmic adaptor subunit [Nitrosospira sp. NpAV]|uniref:efflux RND transporter periplasmic adaptor subunit n=1 Tax=Nitrosospira sp. NpAV TaxID=58133 RepID=UPI00059EDE18|nr:efflux RND transporter periplasmic adaptor subunit [Nitrosospira sp. NpAV]KIO48671.1 cation transporter [Nitrosospira sp. NpAV]